MTRNKFQRTKIEDNNQKLPYHIAIIMDGNGRWAEEHNLPRISGHREGVNVVKKIVKGCLDMGIRVLTLYVFSSENWKRPQKEVNALMKFLADYLQDKMVKFVKNDIKLKAIGDIESLPDFVRYELRRVTKSTANNSSLTLVLAVNYGSRNEIVNAVRKISSQVESEKIHLEDINEKIFSEYLYTVGIPDPDLLIRTGGEYRVSNFLLWQISYTEIYITKKFWPDFSVGDLELAIKEYQKRNRRFGDIKNT